MALSESISILRSFAFASAKSSPVISLSRDYYPIRFRHCYSYQVNSNPKLEHSQDCGSKFSKKTFFPPQEAQDEKDILSSEPDGQIVSSSSFTEGF